jgi:hypothetical protein
LREGGRGRGFSRLDSAQTVASRCGRRVGALPNTRAAPSPCPLPQGEGEAGRAGDRQGWRDRRRSVVVGRPGRSLAALVFLDVPPVGLADPFAVLDVLEEAVSRLLGMDKRAHPGGDASCSFRGRPRPGSSSSTSFGSMSMSRQRLLKAEQGLIVASIASCDAISMGLSSPGPSLGS